MNVQIRRLATIVGIMLLVLTGAATWIQFFQAPSLNADGRNQRSLYREYGTDRGPIVVGGKAIASSAAVKDDFGYLRSYKPGALYGNVTGYYSVVYGSTGIEKAESAVLNGTSDSLFLRRLQDLVTGKQPAGGSVELTLSAKAQQTAWDALGDSQGAVVVLEPSTGEVLAMVSKPGYDPNELAGHDTKKVTEAYKQLTEDTGRPLEDRSIGSWLYPPGSVFKLVTAAAALESGRYQPDTVLPAPTTFPLPNSSAVLTNYGESSCSANGKMAISDAMRVSCNTLFAQLGIALGEDAMATQAQKFGFGRDLSIPMKVTPSVYPTDMDDAQLAMSAIGQYSDRVTPMQMAMVASAIANGGDLRTPYVVKTVRDSDLNVVSTTSSRTYSKPISKKTAEELRDMMIDVVNNGTGKAAALSGIQVAGKTGTAETAEGEAPDVWFVGFAPAKDPQVAIAVVVEDGGSHGASGSGGTVAAPIAGQILGAILQ